VVVEPEQAKAMSGVRTTKRRERIWRSP